MDKAERRMELLRAARDVFATRGYHNAKIDDIVRAAKVAKGTFYLYFPDKRSVFSELVDGLFSRLSLAILRVDTDGDVEAQIKHNVRAIIAVLLEDPDLTQILLSYAAGLDPEFSTKVRSFYDGTKALLHASLAEGQRLGIVAPGDASMYATFTIGALKEILLEAAIAARNRPREEIVTELFHLLEGGYLRIARPLRAAETRARTDPAAAAEARPKPPARRPR